MRSSPQRASWSSSTRPTRLRTGIPARTFGASEARPHRCSASRPPPFAWSPRPEAAVESLRRNHLRDRQEGPLQQGDPPTPHSRPSTRRSSSSASSATTTTSTSRASGELGPAVLQRIAKHSGRNKLIVEHYIANRERYGKTIVFAPTTLHAQTLASEFFSTSSARRRKPTSSTTRAGLAGGHERVSRRGDADRPRERRDLTEGFDAPKTRTVFIARPTRSEALLSQMIGRALRGPLAGRECRRASRHLPRHLGAVRRSRHGVRRPGRTCRRAEAAAQHPEAAHSGLGRS